MSGGKPSLRVGKLAYSIDKCSGYSSTYHPKHILVNDPEDLQSRWSSSSTSFQYVLLRLHSPAVVTGITFGKHSKVHVCDVKDFQVYAGPTPDRLELVLFASLLNHSQAESFRLRTTHNGSPLPSHFVKIVPLTTWKAHFNFSVWYVALTGRTNSDELEAAFDTINKHRFEHDLRVSMLLLRRNNLQVAFRQLQQSTGVQLEHPLVSQLYRHIVEEGDMESAEQVLVQAAQKTWNAIEEHLFEEYLCSLPYTPHWELMPCGSASPKPRGGHQMCLDPNTHIVYLFGGWDGKNELDDLWQYDLRTKEWLLLDDAAHTHGGPSPRSCHKMCFDSQRQRLYTIGRYVDVNLPRVSIGTDLLSDFFFYDVRKRAWVKLSSDTKKQGGPGLMYDHQMCLDDENQIIYLFGGRNLSKYTTATYSYSGLYAFHVESKTWKLLWSDDMDSVSGLRSRIGHSMLFDPVLCGLYIFAGQREQHFLSDFFFYDLKTNAATLLSHDASKQGGPDAGFTQRATIDPINREFFVLSGLMREKNCSQETVKNTFWGFNIKRQEWMRVQSGREQGDLNKDVLTRPEPCPRFAHQLIYDVNTRTHYLFGGNPGWSESPNLRLGDFWKVNLVRDTPADVMKRCQFSLRVRAYFELCRSQKHAEALRHLQTEVRPLVDDRNLAQVTLFSSLPGCLFATEPSHVTSSPLLIHAAEHEQRQAIFDDILCFLPASLKAPSL